MASYIQYFTFLSALILVECSPFFRIQPNCGPMGENDAVLPDSGFGQQSLARFYYDSSIHKCLTFLFLGGGGDGNNYETLADCKRKCIAIIDDQLSCPGSGLQCKSSKSFNGTQVSDDKSCPWREVCIPYSSQSLDAVDQHNNGRCCILEENYDFDQAQRGVCPESGIADGEKIGRDCINMPCKQNTEICYKPNEIFAICCLKL